MKKLLFFTITLFITTCCTDFPIDEDGLLITDRAECYVSSFQLVGKDHQIATTSTPKVDTLAQTIHAEVLYGTDLKNLWPQFTLCPDAKLEPKITKFMDFSDLKPKEWTVISGNRKVRKTYTVTITMQKAD